MATEQGLQVDPANIRAIVQMSPLQTKNLAKFLPHLSDLIKPLRDNTE